MSYDKGYSIGCGRSCPISVDAQIKNRAATMVANGGIGFARESISIKAKNTMVEMYGCENFSSTDKKKEAMRVTNPMFLDATKKKLAETNIERYGTHCVLLSSEILSGIKQTNIERYGVCNPGVLSIDRALETKKRYKYESFSGVYGVTPLFSFGEYVGLDNVYNWECNQCNTIFPQFISSNNLWPICEKCNPKIRSKFEDEVYEFFASMCNDAIRGDRKLISNELDMYSERNKIAMEVCGLYWHTEKFGRGENYHYKKTKECANKGVHLITIFEDEWRERGGLIRAYISNKLNKDNVRVPARKCKVVPIRSSLARDFYTKNHIQGFANSSIHLGLFSGDDLISCMSFSTPRIGVGKKTSGDYELVRFATKLGYVVQCGFSKLLSNFRESHPDTQIYSFSDNRYSTGDVYSKNGFSRSHEVKARYSYLNPKTGRLEHRFKYTKFKLVERGYDESLTEKEIMEAIGFYRLWDCGKVCWVLK